MSDNLKNSIPTLPYSLRFPTGKVRPSDIPGDREEKNGVYRFSTLPGKPGSLYLGDTFLGRLLVKEDAAGVSVTDAAGGEERILNASIRCTLSAGRAFIHPEDLRLKGGDLIQLDAGPGGPARLLFHDSGALFARGEVLTVGGFWGLRVQETAEPPVIEPEPEGFTGAEVFLGSINLSVRDILALGEGSILQFDAGPGAPLSLVSGGTRLAGGRLQAYLQRQPSRRQTFTREMTAGTPKLFFQVSCPPDREPAVPAESVGAEENSLPSLTQLLTILPLERLHRYLKTAVPEIAACLLKVCAVCDGGKAAELLLRLSDVPGLAAAFVRCNPSANAAHLDGIFARPLASLCTAEELTQASDVPPVGFTEPCDPEHEAAEAVIQLNLSGQKAILEKIKTEAPDLYTSFSTWFFFVEDLVRLNDRAVQKLLREVDTSLLAVVLSENGDEVKQKILNNMSKRAGEMLLEDMEYLGTVSQDRYNRNATQMLSILQRLIDMGEIVV